MKRVVTSLIVSTMISTLSIATSPLIKFSDVYSKTKVTLVNPSSNLQNPWGDASIWGNFNAVSMDLKKKKEVNPWTGTTFYVGYAGTTGDSFLTNLTMGSTARYTFSYDLFNVLKLNYMFNSSQKSGMTANNYNITNYLIHTFDSYNSMYIMGNFYKDYFDGYNYTVTESIGYRRSIINDKTQNLTALIGPAGVQKVGLSPPQPGALSSYYLAANTVLNYKYFLSKTSVVSEALTAVVGAQQTNLQSLFAITSKLTDNMSMQINYGIIYTTAPATEKSRTNTQTTMAIIYGI